MAMDAEIQSSDEAAEVLRDAYANAANATRTADGGSTATTAIVTPDGRLTIAQVGDSPVIVFVQDARTGQIEAYNFTVDHSPMAERARIEAAGGFVQDGRVNGMLATGRAFGDRSVGPGVTADPDINTYDLYSRIDKDDRIFVVVGSDGLTDYTDLDSLGENIKRGGSSQDIARNMVESARNAALQGEGPYYQSDNISAAVVEVRPGMKEAAVISVMDGHGSGGEIVANAVKGEVRATAQGFRPRAPINAADATYSRTATPAQDIDGVDNLDARIRHRLGPENVYSVRVTPDGTIQIEVPDTYSRSNLSALGIQDPGSLPRPANLQSNGRAVIEIPADKIDNTFKMSLNGWDSVKRGDGTPAYYMEVDAETPAQRAQYLETLNNHGIRAELRTTSALTEDGREVWVLAVDGQADMDRLEGSILPSASAAPRGVRGIDELDARIRQTLGSDKVYDVKVTANGSIQIEVSNDFSRSDLKALGIEDPRSLKRLGSDTSEYRAVIEIPADRVPPSLQMVEDTTPSARGNFRVSDLSGGNNPDKAALHFDTTEDLQAAMRKISADFDGSGVSMRANGGGRPGGTITINGSGANEYAKNFDWATSGGEKVPQGLKKAIDTAQGTVDTAKAWRASRNVLRTTIVGGAALTISVGGMIHYAHAQQRDIAREVLGQEVPPEQLEEALAEYLKMNEEVEMMMQAENVAAQGWIFLVTSPAVEAEASKRFSEFSSKWGLSQESHRLLGMSLFDGLSARGKLAMEAREFLPDDKSEVDAVFHELFDRRAEIVSAKSLYDLYADDAMTVLNGEAGMAIPVQKALTPTQQASLDAAEKEWRDAEAAYQAEFDRLLQDPETAAEMMNMMDQDVLIEFVVMTAQYNMDDQHPMVQQLGGHLMSKEAFDAMGGTLGLIAMMRGSRIDLDKALELKGVNNKDVEAIKEAKEFLRDNPEVLHEYIRNYFAMAGDDVKFSPDKMPEVATNDMPPELIEAIHAKDRLEQLQDKLAELEENNGDPTDISLVRHSLIAAEAEFQSAMDAIYNDGETYAEVTGYLRQDQDMKTAGQDSITPPADVEVDNAALSPESIIGERPEIEEKPEETIVASAPPSSAPNPG